MTAPFPLVAIWDLLLVLLLLFLSCGVGGLLLKRIPGPGQAGPERHLFAVAVGMGTLGLLLLGMGAVGLLHPLPLAGILVGAGILARREIVPLPGELAGIWRQVRTERSPSGVVVVLVLLAAGVVLLLGGLPPTTDWDSLMYHLQVPAEWLDAGRIHLPEDNLHAPRTGLVHVLYLPLLALGGSSGPSLLSGAMALLLAMSLLSAGHRLFGALTGRLSALLYWGSSIIVLVAITPRVDVTLALFLFLAHYALLLPEDGLAGSWGLIVAAGLAGLAVAIKTTALAYVGPLGVLGLWSVLRAGTPRRDLIRVGWACMAIFAVAVVPWLVRNALLTGGPLYPFLSPRILPPWLAELSGSRYPPPGTNATIYWVISQARDPFTLMGFFLRPGALSVEAEARSYIASPAFLLLPLTLLFVRNRILMALALPPLGYLLMVLLPFDFTNLRYLIPALPALTLTAAAVAGRIVNTVLKGRWAEGVLVVAGLAALAPGAQAVARDVLTYDRAQVATGGWTPEEYLARARGFSAYWNARTRVDEISGPRGKTLLLFEARGFYFREPVLQDNVLTNWPLLPSIGATQHCLARTGISHVLLNHGAVRYYETRGLDLSRIEWQTFADFQDRCLRLLFDEAGFAVFEVAPGGTGREQEEGGPSPP